jgi:hypothetical protein
VVYPVIILSLPKLGKTFIKIKRRFKKRSNKLEKNRKNILINYYSRDIITNNADVFDITEDF